MVWNPHYQSYAAELAARQRLRCSSSNSQPSTTDLQPNSQSLVTSAALDGDRRANRFGNRSLARSKLKRDGLKAGTPVPDFRLPSLDGRGDFTLSELRGQRVLLVFSSPNCGPCNALAPELEKFHRVTLEANESANRSVGRVTPCAPPGGEFSQNGAPKTARATLGITVVMISRGEPKENRAKVKEHGLTFPVVLQQQWQVSRRYAMFATPIAYLIDEAGIITYDVAVGTDAIQDLMARAGRRGDPSPAFV